MTYVLDGVRCSKRSVAALRSPATWRRSARDLESRAAADARARPSTPALAALIASWLAMPMRVAAVENRTIAPPRTASLGAAARTT
jgi:hypothetical protein